MAIPVINPETACCILQTRGREQLSATDALVNVCGKVLCVSEVVKIKDSQLFLVKFIPNVDVIIKRNDCLHWQQNVSPYKEYVLTGLRPTSLQKGSRSTQRVFAVTKNSRLLLPDEVDVKFVTFSDWCKQYGLPSDLDEAFDVTLQDSVIQSLFSYKGKVTRVLDQCLGVFELDNTVRLYVGPLPAAHKFSRLREGAEVLIQNAHYTSSKEYPRVSLYCCMLTSVKCEDKSSERDSPVKLSQNLQKLLYLEGQSRSQLDQLYTSRQIVRKQFIKSLGERLTEKICSTISSYAESAHYCTKDITSEGKGPKRALIDEFLNTPHHCPLMRTSKVHLRLQTIADVKNSICDVTSETMEWQHLRQSKKEQQAFLGILKLSESTGQVLLCDDTESIEVVCCCFHGNKEERTNCDHVCTGACDCDKLVTGDKFTCSCVHSCCIGKIVAISIYETVSETMVTRNLCLGLSSRERSRSCCDKYLVFDMRNAVYMGNSVQNVKTENMSGKTSIDNTQFGTLSKFVKHRECVNNEVKVNLRSDGVNYEKGKIETKRTCEQVPDSRINAAHMSSKCESLDKQMAKCNMGCKKEAGQSTSNVGEGVNKQEESSLHTHTKVDGTRVFCRKAECCIKAPQQGTVSKTGSVFGNNAVVKADEEDDDFKENDASGFENELRNSSLLSYKLGVTAFKVKPVSNRKRPSVNMHVDRVKCTFDNYEANKMPRTDTEAEKGQGMEQEIPVDGKAEKLHKVDAGDYERRFEFMDDCDDSRGVMVYVESVGSLMVEDKLLRFTMECTVLKRGGLEKMILQFSNQSVKWYPVLHPDACYKLSALTEDGTVLSTGVLNDKLKKVLQKSKARKCVFVKESIEIRKLWNVPLQSLGLAAAPISSVQDILQPDFSQKFVDFEGWIVNRTLVKPGFGPKALTKEIGAGGMYSRLHVQDLSGREDVWVYLNDSNIVCERGLIPGSRVRFYRLERKLSQLNNVYCRLVPISSVQILCLESERDATRQSLEGSNDAVDCKQSPVLYLVDIWSPSSPGQVFQCVCDIEKILKVSLKCLCENCGSLMLETECSNKACNYDGGYRFLARASAIVDDSTSVGMVTLTGSSVQSMLRLSHDQWKCLEEEVSKAGEVFIQQLNPTLSTPVERFVYQLCDNPAVKQTWLMTLKTKSSLDINKIAIDEFCTKNFDTGSGRISTQCLPFLQLECMTLKVFEPSVWSMHHLTAK